MPIKMGLLDGEGNCLECLRNGVLTSAKRDLKICETSTKRPGDMPKMSTEHRNVLETPGNSSELLRNRLESSWKLLRSTIHVTETWARRSRNAYGTFLETFSQCARSCGKTSVKGAQKCPTGLRKVRETCTKRRRKCSKRLQNLRGRCWELSPNVLEVSSNVFAKSARNVYKICLETCTKTSAKPARSVCETWSETSAKPAEKVRKMCSISPRNVL